MALALDPEVEHKAPEAAAGSALADSRQAQQIDALSVVAAAGTARLAAQVGDMEAAVAAALAHAELASDRKRRAAFLVQAAGQLVAAQDPESRSERFARAGTLLERALDADPEALPAIGLLVAVRGQDGARDRLLG